MTRRQGRSTSTSNFGVGARESHDASGFYARFTPKSVSTDEELSTPFELLEPLVCGDSRKMGELPDNSVALVVTSPPYFAGKEYEEALGEGVIPASYAEYLELLADVFAECQRVLEPGGRIAVNVANLGRKPYRSLSADVIRILDDDLGMLLRGEIVWKKADGASGSCAWGSYRSPTNPVLRDITERVVVASKGRFDRAVNVEERRAQGRPWRPSISTDEFLEATLDVWEIRPESARRVRHPAPFPVELPQRLIELYTFGNDLVLDPFLGSGSTAVAAVRTGRRYIGYDTDPTYIAIAKDRVEEEVTARSKRAAEHSGSPIVAPETSGTDQLQSRSTEEGKAAQALAVDILTAAGFKIVERDHRIPGVGILVNVVAEDADKERWYFDVTGAFTSTRGGLLRTDTLWKCLGRASVLRTCGIKPVVLLSSHLPPRRSTGDQALRKIGPGGVHDVMGMLIDADRARLADYAAGGHSDRPLPGFWLPADHRARPFPGFWSAPDLGSGRVLEDGHEHSAETR
ncbi:MAG: DNA-methyltransferase [Acidimicrobiales bacterium]